MQDFQLPFSDSKMENFQLNTTLCTLLLFITFLEFAVGVDTLFPHQTIGIGQTLISQNQMFEVGFFSPGTSTNSFLGIWYKNTPDVVVWVANRNNPISDSHGVVLAIAGNRALVISRNSSIIWLVESSEVASNPVLRLLDTGNLVLADKESESSSEDYIWQSFDYPTDTWLPGMKMIDDADAGVEKYLTSWKDWDDPSPGDFIFRLVNQGLPEFVVFRGTMKRYRTGNWNGLYFNGIPRFSDTIFDPDMFFKEEWLISMVEPYDSSIFKRVKIEKSGVVHLYVMNARRDKWNIASIFPRDPWDEYSLCGPNGICWKNFDKSNTHAIEDLRQLTYTLHQLFNVG